MRALNAWIVVTALTAAATMFAGDSGGALQIGLGTKGFDYLGYPTNSAVAAEKGRTDARRDVSNGVLRLPMYGLPAQWAGDYYRILEKRYNVHPYGLAGCSVSEGLVSYAKGYSEVSSAAIRSRFGTNALQNAIVEAKSGYQMRLNLETPLAARRLETHRVKPGETLSSIAKQHRLSLEALTEVNPRISPKRLQINQVLLLPHRAGH